ncbi:MAG: S8 family serine peptidase [Anaerolineae bacterium]|nr:S8 family serine peptidase [Anaerolineae bacterium]
MSVNQGEKVKPDSKKAKKYEKFLEDKHDKSLSDANASTAKVHDYTMALNGYSAVLTDSQAEAVKAQKDVLLVLEDQMRYKQTDSSPDFLGLTVKGGAYDSGYTGEDVVVGIIDTGIWPEHPSFADDGSYGPSPIPPLDGTYFPTCDFGNAAHNLNDAPFTCNNKLIGARQMLGTYRALIGADPDEFDSARDDDGHGTHTASTAAGNANVEASMYGMPLGTVSGIAPRARVIAYKGLGNLGGFTSDLVSAIDQAVADGVDVINYSIGGGASLAGGDDIAFLFAANAGVFVATSAGNSGPGPKTVGGPGTIPWITTVGASTQERFYEGTAELGNGEKYTGASITPTVDTAPLVDAEFAGGDLCIPGTLDASVAGSIVLCRRGAIARADKSLAVFEAGGVGMIMYENTDDNSLFSDTHWVPSVHVDNTPGLEIKAYIASELAPTAKITSGESCSKEKSGKKSGKKSEKKDSNDCTGTWPYAPSMTYFSSRGPNSVAPDIIKPDITAPGIQILAGNSPFPDPGSYSGELFQAIAGTSMSSPHVAGIFALLKQAHPEWSAAAAKSALMTTAYQKVLDNDRKSNADPFDMGAGHADPGGRWDKKGSINNPGLIYDAGLFEYAAFTCGMDLGVFTSGSCNILEGIGVPFEPYNLNLPSIGVAEVPGSQTVIRTVTNVSDKKVNFDAKVKAPKDYQVEVTPKKLKLNPGESATFAITITNKKAPVGEWRFGSLTWKGGGYEVYSPIAVKAALFTAPAEVFGTDASGSASFDVNFGYSGVYTAAPHGLVADAPTNDDISQDPDQTYPSGDDGVGVDMISFPISGAAFVRFELVIPGPDDIDLFLENSGGTIIAASTNGGTDELIELFLPADDTYTMVVHGWSVPNQPLPYTLHYWEVPLATGGSLSLDSAPASATLGTLGAIDVSWSGLASGTYLGAVSHTGDVGLMGLTLVNVDVP